MGGTFFKKRWPGGLKSKKRTKSRPKTFKTEEKAKVFAEKSKISSFVIKRLSNHKFRVDKQK